MISVRGDGVSNRIELNLESHPANLASARRAVEAFSSNCGFDEASAGEIGLCVNEALANVMRHAYHGATDRPIVVTAEWTGKALRISIRDWGSGQCPADIAGARNDPRTPGGVGMICLRELMDNVRFTPQDQGILMVMTRKKSRAPRQQCGARVVG